MRKLTFIFFLFFFFIFGVGVSGNENDFVEIEKLAEKVKVSVLHDDFDQLMKYVSPKGTYFIDSFYTYKQIDELIKQKDSWLYKHLFADKDSVKNYFQKAENLEIKINNRNDHAVFVSYRSSNFNPINWVECCFIRINGKWYFDGIFSCE